MSNLDLVHIDCPYCGERIDVQLDVTGAVEDYVEDCTVCCRPILLHIERDENGVPYISARRENE